MKNTIILCLLIMIFLCSCAVPEVLEGKVVGLYIQDSWMFHRYIMEVMIDIDNERMEPVLLSEYDYWSGEYKVGDTVKIYCEKK